MNFLRAVLPLKKMLPKERQAELEELMESELFGALIGRRTLGIFGGLRFEVSTLKVMTLRDMKRRARARYATHEVFGQKSVLEYVGLEPDEITFDVQLIEAMGVDVQEEMAKMLDILRGGEEHFLILGTHAYGQYKWVLESADFKHEYTDAKGNPIIVTASLTFKEVRA